MVRNYVVGRSQYVVCKESVSEILKLSFGVPESRIGLGPDQEPIRRSEQLPYLFPRKKRPFRSGDAMIPSYFLVTGHQTPTGVSFAGNSI